MDCPVCELPLQKDDPKKYVGDEAVHKLCDLDGAGKAPCGECFCIHAPAQKVCW